MMKAESNNRRTAARSLRRLLIGIVSATALVVLGLVATGGVVVLRKAVAGDEDARIVNSAALAKQLVERVLAERSRQAEFIAATPSVVAAAVRGGEVAAQNGLTRASVEALEERFRQTRSQQVHAEASQFLRELLPKLDIAEVMITDQYGYNAVTTSQASDFVQSDEAWWQRAWNDGASASQAMRDEATNLTVLEMARVIRGHGARVGVVKVKFGLGAIDSVLAQGSAADTGLRVDLIAPIGRVIASSGTVARFSVLSGGSAVKGHYGSRAFTYPADSGTERGVVLTANRGRWRVVAHMSDDRARAGYNTAKLALLAGVGVMFVAVIVLMLSAGRLVERRITGPAEELAIAAEAVAAGDLSKQVRDSGSDDEIGRLARAISSMIDELRQLARALAESSAETASMTTEITASSEEMAAAAGEIAHTASDLSQQSNVMAQTIHALAGSSEHLVKLASELDTGSHDGMQRNAQLRALAVENRARLDDSATSLAALSADIQASASATEQLAAASEEVGTFVTLVQKLARQSKLLALNAAMEAARAGEHGHGFAVVAEEVRRLAATSSDAAEKTERVVTGVLNGVAQSRSSTERTVETVRNVRGATELGSRSFGDIEKAVASAEVWTTSIGQAVETANELARQMRVRLDSLASGTESYAAAMDEVAASSQEQ